MNKSSISFYIFLYLKISESEFWPFKVTCDVLKLKYSWNGGRTLQCMPWPLRAPKYGWVCVNTSLRTKSSKRLSYRQMRGTFRSYWIEDVDLSSSIWALLLLAGATLNKWHESLTVMRGFSHMRLKVLPFNLILLSSFCDSTWREITSLARGMR